MLIWASLRRGPSGALLDAAAAAWVLAFGGFAFFSGRCRWAVRQRGPVEREPAAHSPVSPLAPNNSNGVFYKTALGMPRTLEGTTPSPSLYVRARFKLRRLLPLNVLHSVP
jgi:hypothetical protein